MDEQRDYTISELAEEAGVSTRTIRYYVSEGLLPPPVGSGPTSRYTSAHRERLAIIDRLKAQYLPLREIRRRLVGHGPVPMDAPAPPAPASRPPRGAVHGPSDMAEQEYRALSRRQREVAEDSERPVFSQRLAAASAHEHAEVNYSMAPPSMEYRHTDQPWRRVAISDEAELLITEDQYRRHQDKIDWLVQWAKRVLKP
jgi:DNA-binding transcriptional MerR regulator